MTEEYNGSPSIRYGIWDHTENDFWYDGEDGEYFRFPSPDAAQTFIDNLEDQRKDVFIEFALEIKVIPDGIVPDADLF